MRKNWLAGAAALALAALAGGQAFAEAFPPSTPDAKLVERSRSGDPEADYQLGEFYLNRAGDGDFARAVPLYRRALRFVDDTLGQDNDTSLSILDRLNAALENLPDAAPQRDAAADRLNRLLRMRPDGVAVGHAWVALGTAQNKAGEFEASAASEREAKKVFELKIAEDPWNRVWAGAASFNEGLALRSLGQADEAAAAFAAAAVHYRETRRSGTPDMAAQAGTFLKPTLVNLIDAAIAKSDGTGVKARRAELVDLLRQIEPNSDDLATQLFELSRLHAEGSSPAGALPLLDEAEAVRRAQNAGPALFATLDWERGIAFFNSGDKEKALAAYLKAAGGLDPASATFDADTAALWGNIGGVYFELKQPEKQAEALKKALPVMRRTQPDSLALALTLQNFADAALLAGRKQESVEAAAEGVAIRRPAQPDTQDLALALDGLGRARLALNDFPGAARDFREATDVGAAADPKAKTAAIASRVMLALALYQDHRYDEAIAEANGALHWVDTVENPDPFNKSVTIGNLALFHFQIGRYADAEKGFTRQIAMLRDIRPNSEPLAWATRGLALTYYFLARFDESLRLMREAEGIFRQTQGEKGADTLDTMRQVGWILEGAGRFDEALQVHSASVEAVAAKDGRDSAIYASALSGHAWTLRRMGRIAESEREMQTALDIYVKKLGPADQGTATGYVNLALVKQLLGHNKEAVQLALRALPIFARDSAGTLDGQRWAYEALSLAFRDMGDRRRAILFAKQAINVQQKLRSFNKEYSEDQMAAFRSQWRRLYDNLADMLITEGRLSEAQGVLAMEKQEELVNFIQRDASADTRDTSAALTTREEAEKGEVDAIASGPMADATALTALMQKRDAGGLSAEEDARVTKLEGALDDSYGKFMDDVDAFLAASDAETAGVQRQVAGINLNYTANIQDQLRAFDGKAVMLQVASLNDATHLFLTGPEAAVHREVPIRREDLARLISKALEAVQDRDPDATKPLHDLYDLLVAPVAGDLKASGATTVMLNLQGVLRYVPFAALNDGKRYLIEDYALSLYTPAANTQFAANPRMPDKSAGFGVTEKHPGFSALPGVAREMGAIFGSGEAKGALSGAANLDAKFTRASFQAALKSQPAIVHIASHFKLVPGRETDSFLLLGDGSSLSLADIRRGRGLRFGGVDLLTLSACETGRGADDAQGDEFESFGALAQMNGASAVMATLWPVADEETAALMRSFYAHMMTPGLSKAEALREAQLEAIRGTRETRNEPGNETFQPDRGAVSLAPDGKARPPAGPSHPYFWSPFVLMGNWM